MYFVAQAQTCADEAEVSLMALELDALQHQNTFFGFLGFEWFVTGRLGICGNHGRCIDVYGITRVWYTAFLKICFVRNWTTEKVWKGADKSERRQVWIRQSRVKLKQLRQSRRCQK